MLEVWQNLAIFGSRPIGGAVVALLMKRIANCFFFEAANVSVSQPNGYFQCGTL
jgi:hypothetical protein